MNIRRNGNALSYVAIFAAGMSFGVWLLAATPSGALVDTSQILTGGNSLDEGQTIWTSPGSSQQSSGFANAESRAQLRMPEGVLNALRVKVTTQFAPTSGTFAVTVRKNGVNTILTCQVATTGNCTAMGNVNFAANDRLAIRVSNGLVGSNTLGYTYSLQLN